MPVPILTGGGTYSAGERAQKAEDEKVSDQHSPPAQHQKLNPIEDSIWINAAPARVFKALTDGQEISHWWPKAAESDPQPGGQLILTWFSGGKMKTKFETCTAGKEVTYPFYTEKLTFLIMEKNNGALVAIRHHCGSDAALHVAQSWGFLKANLKSWVEHGIDLRTAE
jgi:uncharacterized protein YndB with AHSA1/START domain